MCYLCWKDTTKANNITFLGLMVSVVNPQRPPLEKGANLWTKNGLSCIPPFSQLQNLLAIM